MQKPQHDLREAGAGQMDTLKTAFVRNVEHELRTPLAIMQGYAELLRNEELGCLAPEQKQAMCVIVDRAYEMRTLVERIGIILSVEGHSGISAPVSVGELAVELVKEQQPAAGRAGLVLESHVEPDVPTVRGDPYQLRHAFECLVENAIKFTPDGGRVGVHVYQQPEQVCFAVSDTGIGISEDKVSRLFSGFYQVDGSTTRAYGGIGLGLTVAKTVVEAHAGHIDVHSQPGVGSRFTIALPVMAKGEDVDQPGEAPGSELRKQRILVVDDEEIVRMTLRGGLERMPDCDVIVAAGGEEALHLFEKQSFDLLITDYKMPGIDGRTLAEHVRQLYPATVIIMLTAYSSEDLLEWAARASVHSILDKPAKLATVRAAAAKALKREA
ncbi:MAG: response regulator [Thermoflexales bacterium]|nr:response regulator [Thermoflexales bacterium]